MTDTVCFYISALTSDGFSSLAEKCAEDNQNTRTFLVRGGVSECAGFIENVSAMLEKEGLYSQRFLNPLDSNLADGAYFPDVDVYIFNGNFTNAFNPGMPDCRQYTVNLGVAAKKKELFLNKALIHENMEKEKKYLSKAVRFLATVKSVSADTVRLSCDAVNAEKIERFVSRFVKREFGTISSFSGKEYFRYLTAVTPQGIGFARNTLTKMCPKLYCIDDKIGFVSSLLVSQIRESAMLCGFDVVSLLSPLDKENRPEHIIVPELGLGVITSNDIHPYTGECLKRVNASRFLDNEKMKKHKTRIKFNQNAEKELLLQTFHLMEEAKKYREEYFEIYSRSFDKEKIQSLEKETVREILSYLSCT
ncbi:MAG: hypothetical protein IJ279_00130 [Clostridia bacterium]|nr:hypothetical protein [Clostridia bacterium]